MSDVSLENDEDRSLDRPSFSVVVPTRDRAELLRACLETVLAQMDELNDGEVIVVDDGAGTAKPGVPHDPRVRLVLGKKEGPGRARNRGIEVARGEVIIFTDDDTQPQPGWLKTAIGSLGLRPDAVGVRGPVTTTESDTLYEHSVSDSDGGSYLTCNVAYRTVALRTCGGFYPGFRFAHEDRDLGWRMEELGPVLFEPLMVVEHPPRPFTVGEYVRRGRFVRDDWILYLRHPKARPGHWPTRWAPLLHRMVRWSRFARDAKVTRRSARRTCRLAVLIAGDVSVAMWVTLTAWRKVWSEEKQESLSSQQGRDGTSSPTQDARVGGHKSLRVAYLGPTPRREAGGAAGCAWLILEQLAISGIRLDCYLTSTDDQEQLDIVAKLPGARVVSVGTSWRFGHWYSNRDLTKMLTGLGVQALGRRRLVNLLAEQHELAPYDALYQFSTIEAFGRRADRGRMPPIVLHPSVHAAGELRWMRNERELSQRCEGRSRPLLVMAWFWLRTKRQQRDIQRAAVVLALSESFGRNLIKDYGIGATRIRIAPNPIDLDGFRPSQPRDFSRAKQRLEITVVGRLSVRKGLELIVQLSQRLRDLSGAVHLEVVGERSQWSNYRRLLDDLDPSVASFHGALSRDELRQWLPNRDLLIQPAKYEPFGLTVGEALASGVPVVVTTEVGSGEGVSETCCVRVKPHDIDALEAGVRRMVARLQSSAGAKARSVARLEAERLWSAASVSCSVEKALFDAAALVPHFLALPTEQASE